MIGELKIHRQNAGCPTLEQPYLSALKYPWIHPWMDVRTLYLIYLAHTFFQNYQRAVCLSIPHILMASRITLSCVVSNFLISRLQCHFLGDRGIVDHTLVKAKRRTDILEELLELFTGVFENSNSEHGQCWAILPVDAHLGFYKY